jgi:single-strand DNA-binding protein
VVFGKVADNCERYLKKGSQVFIEGRLQTQEWQDKTGAKRFTTEVVALNVKFLDGARDGSGGEQRQDDYDDNPPDSDCPF